MGLGKSPLIDRKKVKLLFFIVRVLFQLLFLVNNELKRVKSATVTRLKSPKCQSRSQRSHTGSAYRNDPKNGPNIFLIFKWAILEFWGPNLGLYNIVYIITWNGKFIPKRLISVIFVRKLPKASFQIDASRSASDWLIIKKRRFDWLRVASD